MPEIKLRSYVGEDGILHLDIPVNVTDTELEVTVIFKPDQKTFKTPEELGWSPGFFERTAGSCADDPIIIDKGGIDESLDDNLEGAFD